MKKIFQGAIIAAMAFGFMACGDDSSSSSANGEEKVFTLDEGIIWQPSYGERAWTATNDARNETNFHKLDGFDGYWFTFSEVGSSVEYNFTDTALVVEFSDFYHWKKVGDLYEPDPYPYAGILFGLAKDSLTSVDISSWDGLCLVYEATNSFDIYPSTKERYYWRAKALKTTGGKSLFQFKFENMKKVIWADDSIAGTWDDIVKAANTIQIEIDDEDIAYTEGEGDATRWNCINSDSMCDDLTIKNTIRIYKIGKYGACGE